MTAAPEARLTVVGSGTLFPSATRSCAALHLAVDEGPLRSILLDCGWGTLHALPRRGIDWESIDAVAVTHYHGDHVGDLPALIAAWRQRGRARPLTLFGPADFGRYLAALEGVFGAWLVEPGFPLERVELTPGGAWTDGDEALRVSAVPTPHTEESVALRLQGGWGVLGYTGDTGPSEDVARFLAGSDVLVAECALPDPPPFEGHLTPRSLAALARIAGPGLLIATHVYPPLTPAEAVVGVREGYPGRVRAAADGTVIVLTAGAASVHPA